jgi:uncharacterized membrane protein YgcG
MRMKRLVGAAGVLLAVLVVPGVAQGQESTPPCEAMVVDTSGRVADVARVTAAADHLAASANAYVRVRVESGVGNDAEARLQNLQALCPDWLSGGVRRADFIAVIVLTDTRQTGIYFGSSFNDNLTGETTPIQVQTMNPRFKEGFFDIGIADGLDAIGVVISGGSTQGSSTPLPNSSPDQTPTQYPSGPSYDSSPSSDGSSGAGGLVAILVLIAVGGVVVAISKALSDELSTGSTSSPSRRRASGWFGGSSSSGSSWGSWGSSSGSGSSWGSSSSSHSSSSHSSSSHSSSSSSGSSSGGGSSTSW